MKRWRVILLTAACSFGLGCGDDAKSTRDFKSLPTTVKSFENDTVTLPCHLENAGTEYSVKWIKDGKVMVDTADPDLLPPFRVRLYANYSLQVNRVQQTDTGEYVCEVIRTEPWSPIRQHHAIEVLLPPSVVTIPEVGIVEVKVGDDVDIGCKATGVPQPYITWMSKGEPLELIDHRSRLKFKATSRHLAGYYDCIASNSIGEDAKASIQVVIMHPPEVESDTQWLHTAVGLRAQLQCRVVASPSAKVHWFHGYNPVLLNNRIVTHSKGDLHILVIRKVRDTDLGTYSCKAENRIGMAETKMQLSGVANKAVFKTDNDKNRPTPTTYTLIWEVDSYSPIIEYHLWFRPYKPRPPQKDGVYIREKDDTWMKLTIPGDASDGPLSTASYTLRGLTASTVYEALVISRNRYGWSKPSATLRFSTDNFATDKPRPTETVAYLPVIEDTDMSSKDFPVIYSTPLLEKENVISLESSASGGGKFSSFSLLFFMSVVICVNIL